MIKGIEPRLSEAGKIKIGELGEERTSAKGTKWRPPKKLDHFLVTKTHRGADGNFIRDRAVMDALPKVDGKILEIPILLHSDDIDEVFPTSYALYAGKSLACTGNGETATRWAFDKSKKPPLRLAETTEVECVCPLLEQRKCKPHGTLYCSIRVPNLAVAGAVYTWRTTGIISVQRMIGSLQQILMLAGTLRGLPLALCVQPVKVAPDGKTQTVYSCHVELRATDLVSAQRTALEAAQMRQQLGGGHALPEYRQLVAPPAARDEPEDVQAEIAEEFYPVEDADIVGEADAEPAQSATEAVKAAAKKAAGDAKPKKAAKRKAAAEPKPEPKPEPEPAATGDDEPDYGGPDDEGEPGDVEF